MSAAAVVNLQFDPVEHIYSIDGRRIPNVTHILEDLGIVDYSRIPPSIREAALDRGRDVHDAIAFWLQGDFDEESLAPEYRGYFEAGQRFAADASLTVEPDDVERRLYVERPEYCGTLDLEGTLSVPRIGTRRCLIDWKSGTAEPWVRLQTAGYAKAFANPATRYRVCVELHEDGTYKPYWMPPNTFMDDWRRWEAAVTTYYSKRNLTW